MKLIPLFPRLDALIQGPSHRWWVLAAMECGNFVVYMDSFIVTLALPAMARQFHCGLHEVKWVLIAYVVSLTVCLLLAGRLADRFGRKTITIAGMGTLAVGSVLCFFAPSLSILIVSRVLQGIGGALVLANVMAKITSVFPREERRKAMAFNASVLAMGQVTGLLVGGWFIEWLGWRSIFLVILAFTLIGLVMDLWVLRKLPPPDTRKSSFDLWGALLSVLVVGAPFLLIELSSSMISGRGAILLVGCFLAVAAFIAVEARASSPVLSLQLFRLRLFVCGSLAALCYFVAATFSYFLIPLYAQLILGLSPFSAGLIMLPLSISLTLASQLVGKFSKGISARIVSTIGLLCTTAGVFGLSLLGPSSSVLLILGLLALVGAGGGIFHPPNNTSVLTPVPAPILGSANGFFTTARNFGQAIGASLAAVFLVTGLGSQGALRTIMEGTLKLDISGLRDLYIHAQQHAFVIAACFGLLGALFSAFRGPPFKEPAQQAAG